MCEHPGGGISVEDHLVTIMQGNSSVTEYALHNHMLAAQKWMDGSSAQSTLSARPLTHLVNGAG